MAIEDKNGCLHSEKNGRFVHKTDAEIFNALCKVFGINNSIKDRRKVLIARLAKE